MFWIQLFIFAAVFLTAPFSRAAEKFPTEVQDVDGKSHTLLGKAGAVFIFVLPDCPVSNSYAPEINRLATRYTNFHFFIVQVDSELDAAAARKHAEEFQLRPPVLLDPAHRLIKWAEAKIAPEVAVFSPAGKRLYLGRIDDSYAALGKKRMQVTQHDLRDALAAITAGKAVPKTQTKAIGCYIPEIKK